MMEGLLMVPPERGIIIGRALWKTRYVVLGTGAHLKTQNDLLSQSESRAGLSRNRLKSTSSKPSLVDVTQHQADTGLYISIYKAKVWMGTTCFEKSRFLTLSRATGNLLLSILSLRSRHAKYEMSNTESKVLPCRRSCSISSQTAQPRGRGNEDQAERQLSHLKTPGPVHYYSGRCLMIGTIYTIGRLR